MLDLQHLGVGADLQVAGVLALGQFGDQGGPLGARLAALETEADLLAGAPVVPLLRVDRHVAAVEFLVAHRLGAGRQDLVVVVAGQARDAVGARDAHLGLGLGVVGLKFLQGDRPVQQVGAGQVAVMGAGLELVLLEAQAGARPVDGRAADRLDDPGRQAGEVLGDPPASRRGPLVEPAYLGEGLPLVVDEFLRLDARSRFQDHHLDALLGQFVAQRAAAGPGAHDHHDAVVVEVEFRSHVSRSSRRRLVSVW